MNYGALKSIPKNTTINGQPHQLSYINPEEATLLKSMGGSGRIVNGIPAYDWENSGWNPSNWGGSTSKDTSSSSSDDNDDKGIFERAWDYGTDVFTEIVTAGQANTDTFNSEEPSNTFVTDAGNAVVNFVKDTGTEIITGGAAITGTYNKDVVIPTTTKTALELSMESTKTQAELESEAKTAGQEMYMYQGNYYPVTTEFFDAFGNSYATQARATAADKKAEEQSTAANAGVTVLHTSKGLPYFYDNGGKQHSTLAGAINANETIDLNAALDSGSLEGPFNEQLGLTFTDSRGLFHTSQADVDAADNAYAIEDSATSAVSSGSDEVSAYIANNGITGLEDRFLVGRINPATGLPYDKNDTNIVNPLDADTIPYSPDGYTDAEIQLLGGDPYQNTEGGIVQTNDAFRDPTTEVDGKHGQTFTDEEAVELAVIKDGVVVDDGIDSGAYLADNFGSDESYQRTRDVRGTRDLMGDFIGGRSGGMWSRAPTYLTRFGYTPSGIDEMVRVVEQEDGTKLYYGADGALLNPELMKGVRLGGPTVSQKIGEEDVLLGTQTLNPDGTVSDTAYTDLYDPELDAGLFNYS